MNKQHTKEPWYTAYLEDGAGMYSQDIFDADGKEIADVAWYPVKDGNKTYTNREENAKRIVACVNACRGIPQKTLEQKNYSLSEQIDALKHELQVDERIIRNAKEIRKDA